MIPESIKKVILDYCQANAGMEVSIHHEDNPYKLCGLSFDINGKAKLSSGNVNIIDYLFNHIKYSRIPISIKIDGKDLKEFKLLELPIIYPEPIDTKDT